MCNYKDCTEWATYGYDKNSGPIFCKSHKEDSMVSIVSEVNIKLIPVIKEWFKNQKDSIEKCNKIRTRLESKQFEYLHNEFRYFASRYLKNLKKSHKPDNFFIIALFAMTNEQVDDIDENLKNLRLHDIFEPIRWDYEEDHEICCCMKEIHNIIIMKNRITDIEFQVGTECVEKNNLVLREDVRKIKKEIKEKQKEIERVKKHNMCIRCKEHNIPKIDSISNNICSNCKTYNYPWIINCSNCNKHINQQNIRAILNKTEIVVLTRVQANTLDGKYKSELPDGGVNRLEIMNYQIEPLTVNNSIFELKK
jgi:hypothetical protein